MAEPQAPVALHDAAEQSQSHRTVSQHVDLARLAGWERSVSAAADRVAHLLSRYRYLAVFLCSTLYLLGTCYRASRRLFWFDEIFTVYLSRLPGMDSIWSALKQGADFNPPLFYALTHASEALLGQGHLGARLPEILGFLIGCLCIYRFVSVRTSVLAGLLGMLFPIVTTAYFYAYEARPHGIIFGCAGLSLVCWQAAGRQGVFASSRRVWWLAGLFGSLLWAMLTHTYAVLLFVPLTLAECARTLSRRRVDWAVWLAILSASLGVLVSLPLLRAAKAVIPGVFPATSRLLANSYELLLGPAAGVLSAALILYCVSQFLALDQPSAPNPQPHLEFPELVALLAFVAIPFFAFFVAKIAGSPFVLRYAITSILGFSCLFGIAVAARPAAGLAVLLVLIGQIAINFLDYAKGTSVPEPVTSLELSTSANRFAEKYQIIRSAPNAELPIVLMVGDLQFLPIFHYAPPDLASRLVYLQSPGSDPNFAGAVRLRRLCGFPGRFETPEDFLPAHPAFLAFTTPISFDRINDFVRAGASVTVESVSEDAILALVTFRTKSNQPAR